MSQKPKSSISKSSLEKNDIIEKVSDAIEEAKMKTSTSKSSESSKKKEKSKTSTSKSSSDKKSC